jgi:signal transduction histidine kinase/HAMP domain-containing protein
MRRWFSGLRVRLLLLVLIAVLPALVLTISSGLEQRQVAAAQARQEAQRLAWFASADQARLIEAAHQLLVILAQLDEVRSRDLLLHLEPAQVTCSTLLADLLRRHPHYANFGVADLNGDVLCSAVPASSPVNFADRDWFQRVLRTHDFTVGEYVIGRIVGKALIPFAYPIVDDIGQVQAVLFGSIDLAWLNQFVAEAQLPQSSTLTVIDRNGTILARHPEPEKWVGEAVPDAPIVQTVLRQGAGTAETTGTDGVLRLYAFTPLLSSDHAPRDTQSAEAKDLVGGTILPDAYVYVGIPAAVAYAEVNRLLARNLAGLGLATLLALVAAWTGSDLFILRRIKALVRTTRCLAAGDLSARMGPPYGGGELSQLAHAFDQMAAALEERAAERQQAEDALRGSEQRYRALCATAQRQAQELLLLDQVRTALARELDLPAVIRTVVEGIAQTFGYTQVSLYLLEGDLLRLQHQVGYERVIAQIPITQGVSGRVARTGQPVLLEDVRADPTFLGAIEGIVSEVCVPLCDQSRVVGTLNVESTHGVTLTEADLRLMTALSEHIGIAIGRARLYAEVRESAESLRQRTIELQARNEELDAFAHTVAHDLKNPVALVTGFAEVLGESYTEMSPDEVQNTLRAIVWNGRKMSNIVDELLLLAEIRGKEIEVAPLDMAAIVAEAQQRLTYMIEESFGFAQDRPFGFAQDRPFGFAQDRPFGFAQDRPFGFAQDRPFGFAQDRPQVEIILPAVWPAALGYAPWVEEVWVNYLSNAIKYGGRPARVELGADFLPQVARSAQSPKRRAAGDGPQETGHSRGTETSHNGGGYVRFWVRDNGPGLPPEEQTRLFTPFTRLNQTRARGHGLGLSIVRRIVEKLGGQVGVESEVGRGSVFSFTLPAAKQGVHS